MTPTPQSLQSAALSVICTICPHSWFVMEEFVLRAERAYEPPEASLLFTFSFFPPLAEDCTCYRKAEVCFALSCTTLTPLVIPPPPLAALLQTTLLISHTLACIVQEADRRKLKGCVRAGHFIRYSVQFRQLGFFFRPEASQDRVDLKRRRLCAAKCLVEVGGQRSER